MTTLNRIAAIAAAAVLALAFTSLPAFAAPESKEESRNLVEVAKGACMFETLLTTAVAAGLAETLSEGGPFTVLAPTDEAFAKLPEGTIEALLKDTEALKNVLLNHVIDGNLLAEDVAKLEKATPLLGQELLIDTEDGVTIGGAKVLKADVMAKNGVIHVIDAVIVPAE